MVAISPVVLMNFQGIISMLLFTLLDIPLNAYYAGYSLVRRLPARWGGASCQSNVTRNAGIAVGGVRILTTVIRRHFRVNHKIRDAGNVRE